MRTIVEKTQSLFYKLSQFKLELSNLVTIYEVVIVTLLNKYIFASKCGYTCGWDG